MNAIINKDSIGLYLNGNLQTVKSDHPYFEEIKDAIREKNEDLVSSLIDKVAAIQEFGKGIITVEGGVVYFNDKPLHNHLTQRITELIREGFSVDNLITFIKNLYENPEEESINELYDFLERYSLPITEDGCFLAYKAITNNFKDIYTRNIDNSIGQVVTMDRELVNKNRREHCSAGLHVGAIGYVKEYGGIYDKPIEEVGNRVMIVKVNPRDAVSVPNDHNCAKLRTCQYTVIAELADYNKVLDKAVYTSEATEKMPEANPLKKKIKTDNQSDEEYFTGRMDGELDANSGIQFKTPSSKSAKYIRGYKRGYHRAGFDTE